MSLTHEQIAQLQHSLTRVSEQMPPGDTRFYDRLFRQTPEMRAMFRDDIAGQGMKFMSTLGTILDVLIVPAAFERDVLELGRNHAAMGVEARHFAPLGDALFDTFHDSLFGWKL